MEPSPPLQSSSVLSLVKRLVGTFNHQTWIPAYETLLDISGQHRNEAIPRNPREHLADVISEFLIVGDLPNAHNLERLSTFLSGTKESSDCLLVLLLCANNTREKPTNVPSFPVAELIDPPITLPHNLHIQPFTNEYAAEPKDPPKLPFATLSSHIDSPNSVYCIADTSRCEHDTYNLWLRSNLDNAATKHDAAACGDYQYQQSSAPFLHNPATVNPERSTPDQHLVPDNPVVTSGITQNHSRDFDVPKPFLHEVCHLCLAGPIAHKGRSSYASVRPTSLFEASAIPGKKPSNERSHAFGWRRDLVDELKKWSQQLRQRSRQQKSVPFSTRALMCGLVYQSVLSFAPAYLSKQSSTALKALVSFIALRTDEYLGAILEAAVKLCSDPTALDLLVLDTAESFSVELREIAGVLEAVEETDGSSELILRAVSGQLRRFPSSGSLQGLFLHITGKYKHVLNDWVKEGWCNQEESTSVAETTGLGSCLTRTALKLAGSPPKTDPTTSTQNVDALFSESQALFFRRAGYGRAILRELSSSHSSPGTELRSDAYPNIGDLMKHYGHDLRSRALCSVAPGGDSTSRNPVTQAFTSPLEACSEPQSVQDQSLDDSLRCLRWFSLRDEIVLESKGNHYDLLNESNLVVTERSNEVGRVEFAVYPTLYVELTVDQFRKQDEQVQRKVLNIFVTDLEVFAHLNFIRKFVLLGTGDFANELVEQMNAASSASESSEVFLQNRKRAALTFYGSADAGKSQVRSLVYLRRCFRTAAYLFNADTERFVSRLTVEIPSSVDGLHSRRDLWDYQVEFGYNVPDPLKLVISEDAMRMYSKIHWFFLRVNRAKMSLRNLFMVTRRRSMLNKLASQNMMGDVHVRATLWLFCMDSEQFVNKLGGFFMDQVIGSAWESFQDVWTSCENVWALRDAHQRFLEGSLQRCLLDPRQKSLCSVINGGFDIIHNVEKDVMKLHKSSTMVAMKVANVHDFVSSASASLRRRSLFLADILERLSEAGTWHATSSAAW